MSFRTYHEVTGEDRSQLGEQVASQRRRVHERLSSIEHIIAVMSGKGGVGKSYVAAAVARALASREYRVGVLDADLSSPTVARMLGADGPLRVDADGVHPAQAGGGKWDAASDEFLERVSSESPYGAPAARLPHSASISVFSTDLLLAEGVPLQWKEPQSENFVWRGLLETGALREFLSDVTWGQLDVLIVDLPPGTDKLDDLAQLVPDLAGAIAVTIPSEESRRSVERAMRSALATGVTLLGVIENMSGYECAGCGRIDRLFDGDAGARLAEEFGAPLFARLPFRASRRLEPPALPATTLDAIIATLHPRPGFTK